MHPELLDNPILSRLSKARAIRWLSPLEEDDFAEYRDAEFLKLIGHPELVPNLAGFWPARGPQWDALGLSDIGDVLLVEAKAHIGELFSPATQASEASRRKIERSLSDAALFCRASPRAAWTRLFYQFANRLAHLYFLRRQGISAYLVLVNFLGDADMDGPQTQAEWEAAFRVALHVMGLSTGAPLLAHTIHVYPKTAMLA